MGRWFGDSYSDSINSTLMLFNRTATIGDKAQLANNKIAASLSSHKYGATLTVFGVFLLDLDCDACQSPSRAYLLDVTNPDQHSLGLTTFTFMAGLGGSLGYFLGGIPWEHTFLTYIFGDHIHVVFTLVWIIYVVCMILTLTASKEPASIVFAAPNLARSSSRQFLVSCYKENSNVSLNEEQNNEGSVFDPNVNGLTRATTRQRQESEPIISTKVSYLDFIRSIIYMPTSLRWLCLTNFFCWMALVSYSLYFTDFVGQAVFGKCFTSLRTNNHIDVYLLFIS
jgi:solute carrier family 45, member 1/2/4